MIFLSRSSRPSTLGAAFLYCCLGLGLILNSLHLSANQQSVVSRPQLAELKQQARTQPHKAIKAIEALEPKLKNKTNRKLLLQLSNIKSYANYLSGQYAEAISLAKTVAMAADVEQYPLVHARALVLQAHVLQAVGVSDDALVSYRNAIKIYQQLGMTKSEADVTNSVANVYLGNKEFDLAIDYYQKLIALDDTPDTLASMYLGIGNAQYELGRYQESKTSLESSLLNYKINNDKFGTQLAYTGLGNTEIKLGRLDAAKKHYEKAIAIAKLSKRNLRLAGAYVGLADIDSRLGNIENAEKYFAIATRAAGENATELQQIWKEKIEFYESHNNIEQAYFFTKKLQQNIYDKAQQSYLSKLAVIKVLFELDAANNKVALLSKDNELKQLKLDAQRQMMIASASIMVLFVVILLFYFIRKNHLRQLQEEKALTKKLREIDKLKDNVLANTSHELRTPLNGILGLSEVMLSDDSSNLDEVEREHLALIHKSGERLLTLVEDIIDVSKIREGRLTIERQPTDLRALVEETVSLLKPIADNKKLTLTLNAEKNMPSVEIDGKRITQVFSNLIKNSIKYSRQGNIVVTIERRVHSVYCEVRDQGSGIELAKQQEIFEPFERSNDGDYKNTEGAGLGLAIVKEILSLHQIEIFVDSAPGLGARFYFEIPYR